MQGPWNHIQGMPIDQFWSLIPHVQMPAHHVQTKELSYEEHVPVSTATDHAILELRSLATCSRPMSKAGW